MCAPFRCASPCASGNAKSMFAGCVTSPRCNAAKAVRMHSSASGGPTSERTSVSESANTSGKGGLDALDEDGLVLLRDRLDAEDELAVHRHADDARVAGCECPGELVLASRRVDDECVHRLGDEALVERELGCRAADLRGQPLRACAVRRPAGVVIHCEPLLEREHRADD